MTAHLIRPGAIFLLLPALAACTTDRMDWDLRRTGLLNTSEAAQRATASRPVPDARGVLSYPGYQVALARRGDTVSSVAARVGVDAAALARFNALQPADSLRAGEILALPGRVAEPPIGAPGSGIPPGAVIGGGNAPGPIDVTTIAGGAIDRASGTAAAAPPPAGAEPARHRVMRGETASIIARQYGVTTRALADWNALGPDLIVREGQYLLIPTALPGAQPPIAGAVQPGQGSPTPVPPSASRPLPAENPSPASAAAPGTPASPDLGSQRTGASAARMGLPVDGRIIRGFAKGRNEGIDFAASAGTPVRAAADGTVAAITKDTDQVPILVLRHADGLLTVYAGIDRVSVARGAAVKRGQQIAVIRAANPSFLHFEVRKGVDAVDPAGYLN